MLGGLAMRVYHFISAEYALDDLRKRRLKVSFLEDMNDPFELLGGSLKRPELSNSVQNFPD